MRDAYCTRMQSEHSQWRVLLLHFNTLCKSAAHRNIFNALHTWHLLRKIIIFFRSGADVRTRAYQLKANNNNCL